jgi:hypothetical protein
MKKHIINMAAVLMGCLFTLACSDNDYEELDKGITELALSVNQAADELNEQNHSAEAVTLSWTTGHNFKTGNRLSYVLELAEAGTDFANAYTPVEFASQTYEWTATQEELNDILLNELGATPGEPMNIDVRVTAFLEGYVDTQTSEATFTVTPYEPVTTTLYLIGDATPAGWSADNASPMTRTDNGKFTWEGQLTPGSLKFLTTQGEFIPSYNKGEDGNPVLRKTFDDPDDQWQIEEASFYTIVVDLLAPSITITPSDGETPAFDQLYFVGNCTSWNFVEMQRDAIDPFLFRYGRYFEEGNGGEFKFGTSNGSWENMLKATQANAPYTDTSMAFVSGFDPDNKWFLNDNECGKAYKICVDIRSGKERMLMTEFTPYAMIYLVGDATPSGWDIGNATPMTATDDPYVFTWTGNLTAGELKFTCDKKDDWNGAWFMASQTDAAPTGSLEHMLFIDKSSDACKNQYLDMAVGGVDQKWKITDAGTYTIILNQLEETISIVKQ